MKHLAVVVVWLVASLAGLPSTAAQNASSAAESQWHLGFLRIEEAHRSSTGEGVVVGLLDSGVDASHPDLSGSVLDGIDLTLEGPASRGKRDIVGHGTAMAGLIAAHGGATGIAPNSRIVTVRNTAGALAKVTEAVDFAIAKGVRVMCIAQGGPGSGSIELAAIRRAIEADIVVVAAAGNTSGGTVEYPAAYPGVVAVGGVDSRGNQAELSSEGPQLVLSAPSVDIRSTGLNKGYRTGTGTSDATAIVAGVAALVRAKYPTMSAEEVIHRMTVTAIDKGPKGRDDKYGYGIVDPVAALTAEVPPLRATTSPPEPGASPGGSDPTTGRIVLFGGIGLAVLVLLIGVLLSRRRG